MYSVAQVKRWGILYCVACLKLTSWKWQNNYWSFLLSFASIFFPLLLQLFLHNIIFALLTLLQIPSNFLFHFITASTWCFISGLLQLSGWYVYICNSEYIYLYVIFFVYQKQFLSPTKVGPPSQDPHMWDCTRYVVDCCFLCCYFRSVWIFFDSYNISCLLFWFFSPEKASLSPRGRGGDRDKVCVHSTSLDLTYGILLSTLFLFWVFKEVWSSFGI